MKIAYFGSDMFCGCMEMLIQNGHEVITLFTIVPSDDEYDFTQNVCRHADVLGIPIIRSKPKNEDIKELQNKGCDMILSAGYSYKIPPWDGDSIRYGVNIHPSLLPEGAGPVPMPLVIIKELKKTGVTLHKLSQDWDAGDIILQEEILLCGNENLEGLLCESKKLAVVGLERFLQSPEEFWDSACPQIRQDGDYWPRPSSEELTPDFNQNIKTVEKYLRTFRIIDSEGGIMFVSSVSAWQHEHNLEPGTILRQKDNFCLTAAADGLVCFKLDIKEPYEGNFITNKELEKNF